ncbi:MAG: hypothetical protein ACI9X4_001375 [Glaciecola sp.]|jgi:hypothetical protein
MKLLSMCAAALTLSGFAVASETDYSSFDRDIEALVSGRLADNTGPTISGYAQVRYQSSSDITSGGNDLGGFDVRKARVAVTGERQGYGYKVQVDFASGTVLKDAYIDIPINNVSARAGMFRPAFSRNASNSSSKLFFMDRTEVGKLFAGRDTGVMFHGNFDQASFFLSLMNGTDGTGDELQTVIKVAYNFMGAGTGNIEGAFGGPDELSGTISAAMFDDGEATDGSAILIEAHVANSQYSAGIEVFDADTAGVTAAAAAGTSLAVDDETAMTLYGTYMLTPDQWELGVRFQDMDDTQDTTLMEIGVARYLDGHNLKYSLGYRSVDSDNAANEADTLQVQLQVAF